MARKLYLNRAIGQVVDLLQGLTDEQKAEVARVLLPQTPKPESESQCRCLEHCSNCHPTSP